ncbi:hypothetical protein BMI89_15255 [Thioclava sp. F36-7]|nr:hypothetical protein BMI89_15255 [Thioclava sp. F36-7]
MGLRDFEIFLKTTSAIWVESRTRVAIDNAFARFGSFQSFENDDGFPDPVSEATLRFLHKSAMLRAEIVRQGRKGINIYFREKITLARFIIKLVFALRELPVCKGGKARFRSRDLESGGDLRKLI